MGKRQTPIATLLARFGCSRTVERWRVVCRDEHGRRAAITVELNDIGVAIQSDARSRWILSPLDVGRLRNSLREALETYSELRSSETTAKGACGDRAA